MRRRVLLTALTILILLLIQTSVVPFFPLSFLKPNLLLIFVVSAAFMRGKRSGIWIGFAAGIVLDLCSGHAVGFQALVLMLIGYFNGFLCKVFFDEDLKVPVLLAAASDFAYGVLCFFFYAVTGGHYDFHRYLRLIILPEMVSSIIFTLILYKLFFWINQRLSAYELEEQQSPWLRK